MSQDAYILMSLNWILLSLKIKTQPTEILCKMYSKTLIKSQWQKLQEKEFWGRKKPNPNQTNQPIKTSKSIDPTKP